MATAKRWLVSVTVIEVRRVAVVEAETKAEARRKARRGEWLETSDPESYVVRLAGAAREDDSTPPRDSE